MLHPRVARRLPVLEHHHRQQPPGKAWGAGDEEDRSGGEDMVRMHLVGGARGNRWRMGSQHGGSGRSSAIYDARVEIIPDPPRLSMKPQLPAPTSWCPPAPLPTKMLRRPLMLRPACAALQPRPSPQSPLTRATRSCCFSRARASATTPPSRPPRGAPRPRLPPSPLCDSRQVHEDSEFGAPSSRVPLVGESWEDMRAMPDAVQRVTAARCHSREDGETHGCVLLLVLFGGGGSRKSLLAVRSCRSRTLYLRCASLSCRMLRMTC
ncbi:hypothetical protein K438DRAFT_527938 [Mycena galopus ATCC 62051]|nr:hypothetical protein K438DRAFT_527938 [Mycena galopus ATCC 62051]